MDRLRFLRCCGFAAVSLGIPKSLTSMVKNNRNSDHFFDISLAQWSLHRSLFDGDLDHLAFPAVAKSEFDIDAVEYVNQFFADKAEDTSYLDEMNTRCSDLGVDQLLIMVDGEDAGVPEFIDFMMLDRPENQTPMRGGLKWLDVQCKRLFGNDFIDCTDRQKREMLDKIAYPDDAEPGMEAGVSFFNSFRDLVASGFWSSKMGIEDIGYMGNQPYAWQGCSDEALDHVGLEDKT